MAHINYDTVVDWDVELADVGYADADNGDILKGLAISALKITTGAPSTAASVVGHWLPGAIVTNVIDGTNYEMTGSTASPAWTILATGGGGGITALTGDVTASGSGSVVATIAALAVTNAKISATAAIAFSKLATLASGNILVGSAGGVATSVAMSGDATIIASGALTIANSAITTAKIAANAVDGTKIAITSQATGSIMYYDGTDWIVLPIGTAGQTLTVNGGATAPVWA